MPEKNIELGIEVINIYTDHGFISIGKTVDGKTRIIVNANRIGRTVESERYGHHSVVLTMKDKA